MLLDTVEVDILSVNDTTKHCVYALYWLCYLSINIYFQHLSHTIESKGDFFSIN